MPETCLGICCIQQDVYKQESCSHMVQVLLAQRLDETKGYLSFFLCCCNVIHDSIHWCHLTFLEDYPLWCGSLVRGNFTGEQWQWHQQQVIVPWIFVDNHLDNLHIFFKALLISTCQDPSLLSLVTLTLSSYGHHLVNMSCSMFHLIITFPWDMQLDCS